MMQSIFRHFIIALTALIMASCSPAPQQAISTPTPVPPTPTRPATWTPTPGGPTAAPITPTPARTLAPPATPAEMKVVVAQNNSFSIQIPSNWKVTEGTRRVEGRSTYETKYFSAVSPGDAPQPGVIIFYDWPSSIAVTNDNAWESAFALTTLVIKSCATQLGQQKLPLDFGGEPSYGVEYVDACGAAGMVTGAVHRGVNYGALFEAPAPYFDTWQPILRDILVSLTFSR
jgi:hypothetical protein